MIPDPGTRFTYSHGVKPCKRASRFAMARFKMFLKEYLCESWENEVCAAERSNEAWFGPDWRSKIIRTHSDPISGEGRRLHG